MVEGEAMEQAVEPTPQGVAKEPLGPGSSLLSALSSGTSLGAEQSCPLLEPVDR